MELKAKLTLDLGNSGTRMQVVYNDKSGASKTTDIIELSNHFYNLAPKYEVPATYTPETTSILYLKGGYTGTFANGLLVDREFSTSFLKPTANNKKYSFHSCLSFSLALVKATQLIAQEYNVKPSELAISWDVTLLLPAIDCNEDGMKYMTEELEKVTSIIDVFTGTKETMTYKVNLNQVKVYPEGLAAYIFAVFDEFGNVREGCEKYTEDAVLFLDIGAGTTDGGVIQNSELVDSTRFTANFGGNNIKALLKKSINAKYNYGVLKDEQLEEAMRTGTLKDGSSVIDITPLIVTAKSEVAKMIVSSIQETLEGFGFSIRSIGYLLSVGGGTLGGDKAEILPISDTIVEYLREYSPNLESVPLPIIEVNGNSKVVSTRLMNIYGAGILASLA